MTYTDLDCLLAVGHEPLLVLDDEFRIVRASDAFSRQFRIPLGLAIGTRIGDLSGGRWNVPELHQILNTALHLEPDIRRSTLEADFGFGTRTLLINARRSTTDGGAPLIVLAIEDVTERTATPRGSEGCRPLSAERRVISSATTVYRHF